jgi:hypothetical protein
MALNYTELETLTQKKYLPVVVDNIFEEHPLLKLLKERKETFSGHTIVQPVKYDRLNGGDYGVDSTFDISRKEIVTQVSYQTKGIYVNASFDGFENAINSGSDTQVVSIIQTKMESMKDDMKERLVDQVFGDNNGPTDKGFTGLAAVLRDDNTYGGIDRTATVAVDGYDGSFWKAQVFANAGVDRALTWDLLNKATMRITRGGMEKDVVIVVGYDVFDKIVALAVEKHRIMNPSNNKALMGFTTVEFNGVPVIVEPSLQDNDIRFVNLKYFQMRTNAERDFYLTPFKTAQDNDSQVKQLIVMGNFITKKSNSMGIIKDIDPSL